MLAVQPVFTAKTQIALSHAEQFKVEMHLLLNLIQVIRVSCVLDFHDCHGQAVVHCDVKLGIIPNHPWTFEHLLLSGSRTLFGHIEIPLFSHPIVVKHLPQIPCAMVMENDDHYIVLTQIVCALH